jgi:ribosomal protein S18 acetylase RimI-like enzyme
VITPKVKIRKATLMDLSVIAYIHKMQFSDHLLGQLSVGLLERFYASFWKVGILLVSKWEDRPIGFLLGGNKDVATRIKKEFIKNNKYIIAAEFFIRPKQYFTIIQSYRHLIDDSLSLDILQTRMRLLSIAVLDNFSGTGAAANLIGEFEKLIYPCTEYGFSVKKTNLKAINFYMKNGCLLEKDVGESLLFTKTIS